MEFHKLASIFPMMPDDEYLLLKSDIEKNGLLEPIWTYQGKIIDGRNRFKACTELNIQPKYQEWDGNGFLLGFIISLNLKRRHLTASERAAIGAEIEPMFAAEAKKRQLASLPKKGEQGFHVVVNFPPHEGKARDQAADAVRVSGRSVSDAKELKEKAPDKFEEVKSGKKKLAKAKKEFKQEQAETIRKSKATEAKKQLSKDEDYCIKHGHFKDIADKEIIDNAISLIFTDPPYDRKSLKLYEQLGEVAARVLSEGGSLICYFGQYQIEHVLSALSKHLRFWWIVADVLEGGNWAKMREYGVVVKWKPLLWFVKKTRADKNSLLEDLIITPKEKGEHPWQQSVVTAKYFIEKLCPKYGIVFDPFCGGGTTAAAAKLLKRKYITCDIDEASVINARNRIRTLKE